MCVPGKSAHMSADMDYEICILGCLDHAEHFAF